MPELFHHFTGGRLLLFGFVVLVGLEWIFVDCESVLKELSFANEENVVSKYGDGEVMRYFQQCYLSAHTKSSSTCKEILQDDEKRDRYAIHITNCQLEKFGLKTISCPPSKSVRDCMHDFGRHHSSHVAVTMCRQTNELLEILCMKNEADVYHLRNLNMMSHLLQDGASVRKTIEQVSKEQKNVKDSIFESKKELVNLHNSLETLGEKEEERFENMTERVRNVIELSNHVRNSLDRSLKKQKRLLQFQLEIKALQSDMSSSLNESLPLLMEASLAVERTVNESLSHVKDILDNVREMTTLQEKLRESMSESLKDTDVLKDQNKRLFEEGKRHHEESMMKLGDMDNQVQRLSDNMLHSLSNQEELLVSQKEAKEGMVEIRRQQNAIFDNLKAFFEIYNGTIQGLLDNHGGVLTTVSELSRMIFGEILHFKTVVFYMSCILIGAIVTSTRRTSSSRFYVFLIIVSNLMVERFVISYLAVSYDKDAQWINNVVSQCRKLVVSVSLAVVIAGSVMYRDREAVLYSCLRSMCGQ
eukprot:TRINITY_DN12446_c0_g1_i1.p1 TRINITY_DN12446_c0_g1~~TRINITY_DN12446_c0_g1_i1.p1  ORF type:complete len:529 (-),score=137.07 TRINITY_DN12446_c0_g1_i1:22-1608(-)